MPATSLASIVSTKKNWAAAYEATDPAAQEYLVTCPHLFDKSGGMTPSVNHGLLMRDIRDHVNHLKHMSSFAAKLFRIELDDSVRSDKSWASTLEILAGRVDHQFRSSEIHENLVDIYSRASSVRTYLDTIFL
jgi:hypothetical protein